MIDEVIWRDILDSDALFSIQDILLFFSGGLTFCLCTHSVCILLEDTGCWTPSAVERE